MWSFSYIEQQINDFFMYVHGHQMQDMFIFFFWQRAQIEGVTYPASIKDIMDTWISQMNYPVVKVTKSSAGVVHVQQKRFLVNDASSDPGKFVSKFK